MKGIDVVIDMPKLHSETTPPGRVIFSGNQDEGGKISVASK
jgi:hypothetical protein